MTKEYLKYLQSEEWASIKNDLYTIRGKGCEKCGSKSNIHVHHKHYKNIFNEEPEDLIILCSVCHREEHGLNKNVKKNVIKGTKKKKKMNAGQRAYRSHTLKGRLRITNPRKPNYK